MTFKHKLESQEAEEGASVTLRCEISKPGVPVEWKKGTQVLTSGEKYQMKQTASVNELHIAKVVPEDSGDYSCMCGDQKTTANLNIKGRRMIFKESVHGMVFKKLYRTAFHLYIQNFDTFVVESACHHGSQLLLFFLYSVSV